MKTPIFFRPDQELTDEIILDKEEIAHLRSLRLNEEDKKIEIRDGNGCSAIYFLSKKSSKGTLESREIHKLHHKKFKIASAIPKSEKLNFLLQKGTELGISGFIFVNFSNSERKELNLIRSQKIILESCSQSRRHSVPSIQIYNSLSQLIDNELNLIFLDPRMEKSIGVLNENVIPVIGPEGGFRPEEIQLLKDKNITGYTLGEGILRIETAFLFVASVMKFSEML